MATANKVPWYWVASGSLLALIVFITVRELYLAPLRPGGSWLVLKVVPLLLALPGVLKRRLYTYQWAALLSCVYVAFAVVGGMSDPSALARTCAWVEAALGAVFFCATVLFVRPYKRAAKAARVTAPHHDSTPAADRRH